MRTYAGNPPSWKTDRECNILSRVFFHYSKPTSSGTCQSRTQKQSVPNLVHVNRLKRYQEGRQIGDAQTPPPPPSSPPPSSPPLPPSQPHASPTTLPSGPQVNGPNPLPASSVTDENDEQVQVDSPAPSAAQDVSEVHDADSAVSEQPKFYEVERILCKRYKQGQWYYRVKWLSYSSSANSWVPFSDLSPACQTLVTHTHKKIPVYKRKH